MSPVNPVNRPAHRRARLRLPAVAVALLALVPLTACAAEPVPELRPQAESLPVVAPEQLDVVVQGVTDTLTASDAALDPALLPPRVTGPAAELRTAGYAVRRALADRGVVTPVGSERLADLVPADQEWPRTVMTVTQVSADDAAAPVLALLTQATARDPYTLTAWTSLLPGVTVPAVAPPTDGVEVPALDAADTLALAPTDVVGQYADVLTNGPASQYAAAFADDAFRAQVLAEQDADRTAASVTCPNCFSYTVSHAPRGGSLWALGTADGGAIVVGAIDSTRSLAVAAPGAKLPLVDGTGGPTELTVLSGKTEALTSATFTSLELVAFVVPPAGSTDPVQVIGSERALLAAAAE